VGLAERHSRSDQCLGHVRRQEGGVARRGGQPLSIELEMLDQQRRRIQRVKSVVDRREKRRFVLLEVAVIGER
jgi:hypothetical protein